MSTANTRILIVDDEEIVRESLGGWLEKDGYTVARRPTARPPSRGCDRSRGRSCSWT